jgi:hypothetical protein
MGGPSACTLLRLRPNPPLLFVMAQRLCVFS